MSSTSLLLYKKLDKNGNYFECVLNYKFTDHCSSKKIVQATIKTSPPLIVRVQTQYFKICDQKKFLLMSLVNCQVLVQSLSRNLIFNLK